VLAPTLGQFARAYPDVALEMTTTNEGRFDLVAERFDAGIHLGESIERDMIAMRVSPDQRAAIVWAPSYFSIALQAGLAARPDTPYTAPTTLASETPASPRDSRDWNKP
jgi:DNA-binding transcriptional LysR family regulator